MTEILDKLSVARYISTIDLNKAYHQIPLSEESKPKTAFIIPGRGLYQYRRMLFGLTGAPGTFQRLVDQVITSDMRPYVFAYLDDVIVVTENFQDHLYWLEKTINRLTEARLTLSPDNCHFCRSEFKYLGFKINQDGLVVDDDKVRPILDYPPPRNLRQLRRFITKKDQPYHWGDEQEGAFAALKNALISSPVLAYSNFELPFCVQTDASESGLGVVVTQTQDGQERVIVYASRVLSEDERNYYSTTESSAWPSYGRSESFGTIWKGTTSK